MSKRDHDLTKLTTLKQDQERKKIRDEVNKGKQRVQEKYLKAQEAH